MLANQDDLSVEALPKLAEQAGLDVVALKTALAKHTYANAVAADEAAAKAVEAKAAPTFVINGRRMSASSSVASSYNAGTTPRRTGAQSPPPPRSALRSRPPIWRFAAPAGRCPHTPL